MKVPIIINKRKKSRKVNNYGCDNFDNSNSKSELSFSKFINFSLLINQDISSNLQLQLW